MSVLLNVSKLVKYSFFRLLYKYCNILSVIISAKRNVCFLYNKQISHCTFSNENVNGLGYLT